MSNSNRSIYANVRSLTITPEGVATVTSASGHEYQFPQRVPLAKQERFQTRVLAAAKIDVKLWKKTYHAPYDPAYASPERQAAIEERALADVEDAIAKLNEIRELLKKPKAALSFKRAPAKKAAAPKKAPEPVVIDDDSIPF